MNILLEQESVDELAEVFARHPKRPLLPPMGDPEWCRVRDNPLLSAWLDQIRSRATAEVTEPLPELTDEMYADFHLTGRRVWFEPVYMERRRRLARAAIAALVEPDAVACKKWLRSMRAKAQAIFDEPAWAFPAHVQVKSGKDPMRIDLFAAETANLLGELLDLFPGVFDESFVHDIHSRLHTQFFENFLVNPPHWTTGGSNWNAVCHQGVSGAALATVNDPKLLGRIFERVAAGLRIFIDNFTADGGSTEGPGYWGYGFGWMTQLNRQLETRTDGELSLFEGHDKIRKISRFGPHMTLSNGECVNFSDNSHRAAPRPSVLQYLGERLNDDFIRSHAAIGWQNALSHPLEVDGQRMDLFAMTRLLLLCPTEVSAETELPLGHTMLESLGVAIVRFKDAQGHLWEFACKAGHNAEHHNHNDIGSYLLNIDGRRVLIEIGAPEYDRGFFSDKRYTYLAARSMGHPVSLINGVEQSKGQEFKGRLLQLGYEPGHYEIDLTQAYPKDAGCARCVRRITIEEPTGRIQIVDSFEMEKLEQLETALITLSEVTLNDGSATITGDHVPIRIYLSLDAQFGPMQQHTYNGHGGRPTTVNRIVIRPRTMQKRIRLVYTIELAEPGQAT